LGISNALKTDIAVIGGTGLETLLRTKRKVRIGTPWGVSPFIFIGDVGGKRVAFLPRHGDLHSLPPHKINYRANIYALHKIGVKQIVATNAVGAINSNFQPGDLIVPHDFIDFTKLRKLTFYDDAPVTHIDVSQPYCPQIRHFLVKKMIDHSPRTWDKGVLVCTEGPRYETPAEIEMLRRLGCDIVGMTSVPETVLGRELEICYASLCFISNMAAGMQQQLTAREVAEMAKKKMPVIHQILTETIENLPKNRNCPCINVLKDARL
jgi:5'-methylthioadenosine phosphorylase